MTIRTAGIGCSFRIKPNASPADIETRPPISRAGSHQINRPWLAPEYRCDSFKRITGDSQRGGKIISAAKRQNPKDNVSPKHSIRQSLERTIPTHSEKYARVLRNSLSSGQLQI